MLDDALSKRAGIQEKYPALFFSRGGLLRPGGRDLLPGGKREPARELLFSARFRGRLLAVLSLNPVALVFKRIIGQWNSLHSLISRETRPVYPGSSQPH